MKILLIMRHAKAEAGYGKPDVKRNLASKGEKDAKKVGEKFNELGIMPDKIICSAAERTQQTAQIVAKTINFTGEIEEEMSFYNADEYEIIETIKIQDNSTNTLMIVGHNPTVAGLVYFLNENKTAFEVKTANAFVLKCNIEKWDDLDFSKCQLLHYIKP